MKSKQKVAKKPYYTVGVRFVDGHDLIKVYTYRVRNAKKVNHGDLLIGDTPRGPAIVAVVRVDKVPKDTGSFDYKFITQKVANL